MYKSRKKKNMIIALLAALTVGIGSTSAVIRHQIDLKNEISADTVVVEVEEDLADDNQSDWTKPKKVSFKNSGSADVFLRVAYSESWSTAGGADGEKELLSNKMPGSDSDVASKVVSGENWELREDGWYYYKKVLPAGSTTENFMEKVDFSNIASLEESLKNTYKNAEYEIHFQAEAVQASDEWKVSEEAAAALFDKDISAAVNDGATIIDRDQNEDQWPSNKDTAKIIWSVGTAGGGN